MDAQLTLQVSQGPAHVLVTLAGDCDDSTRRQFRDGLISAVSPGTRRLIVDLSALGFLDSAGVHALMSIKTTLSGRGGSLVLVSPRPIVARVLELMGADEVIPLVDSLAEALAYG
jgi:anti-anti-sigma factor